MKKLFKIYYASPHHYGFSDVGNETELPSQNLLLHTDFSLAEFDSQVQPDQINMAVLFCYLVEASVLYCTVAYTG